MITGRVIVVTGASVGIGAAILKQQACKGNIVVGIARRAELIEKIKNENQDWQIHALKVDLTKETDIVEAFAWIRINLGRVDVLINNAAIMSVTHILKAEMKHWRAMYELNVFAPAICTREVLPLLSEDGHIVNIGSVAGVDILPHPDYMVYSSTKFALRSINEGMRLALVKEKPKVRVTIINPGCTATDLSSGFREETGGTWPNIKSEDVATSVDHVLNTPSYCNVTELTVRATTEVY